VGRAALRSESLVSLELRGCGLDDASCAALASTLAGNGTLTRLCLSDNHFGDKGCCALVEELLPGRAAMTPLAHLELAGNALGVPAFAALGKALARSPAVLELDVARNAASDDATAALLLPLQPSSAGSGHTRARLARLRLAGNACGLRTAVALAAVLRAPSSPLAGTHVDLSLNLSFDGQAAAKLEAALSDSTTARLGSLNLQRCGLDKQRAQILEALACGGAEQGAPWPWVGHLVEKERLRVAQQAPLGAAR